MEKKLYIYIIGLCFVGILTSCTTNKQTNYLQKGNRYEPAAYEPYRLRVNDEIYYYLLTSSTETQAIYNGGQVGGGSSARGIEYRIYQDGTIHLPIGQVRIAGLTLREAEIAVKTAFSKVVPDAEIRLNLVNNYFYVLGDGGKGQHLLYKENLNIYQALALVGDISSRGDKAQIKIIRKGADGFDYVKTFDLRQESIIESEFYYVKPNDVIYIPTHKNSFFQINNMSSFVALIITPISFVMMILSLIKK